MSLPHGNDALDERAQFARDFQRFVNEAAEARRCNDATMKETSNSSSSGSICLVIGEASFIETPNVEVTGASRPLCEASVLTAGLAIINDAECSLKGEGAGLVLAQTCHDLLEAEQQERGYELPQVGLPASSFHETEGERKSRLSDQRIAEAMSRLLPGN